MTDRNKKTPEAFTAAEAASQPAPAMEASPGPTDEAFRAMAARMLAKNAELYRRLAQGPTGRHRPDDARGAARRPVTDRSHANRASPDEVDRPTGGA
jgi:hypothetical protein